MLVGKRRKLYRLYASHCRAFGANVDWPLFLAHDPAELLEAAKQRYKKRLVELDQRARADELLRRSHEELKSRLDALLHTLTDEIQKERIRECLDSANPRLEDMDALWLELQSHSHQNTPESRLDSLLASSREYCTQQEFDGAQSQAFAILNQSGFREAREFAVKLHNDLRLRAKSLENEDGNADEQQHSENRSPVDGALNSPEL